MRNATSLLIVVAITAMFVWSEYIKYVDASEQSRKTQHDLTQMRLDGKLRAADAYVRKTSEETKAILAKIDAIMARRYGITVTQYHAQSEAQAILQHACYEHPDVCGETK